MSIDVSFMQRAYTLALQAQQHDEVPVGAVIVYNNEVIGEGYNQPITNHDPTAHAEIIALREAAQHLQNYRLINTTLYVTLEPCAMCVGAMLHARVKRVVFAAADPKSGALGGAFDMLQMPFNHYFEISQGTMAEPCAELLKQFFQARR